MSGAAQSAHCLTSRASSCHVLRPCLVQASVLLLNLNLPQFLSPIPHNAHHTGNTGVKVGSLGKIRWATRVRWDF